MAAGGRQPSGGDSEGSRGSETWSIAAPAPRRSSRPIRSSRSWTSRGSPTRSRKTSPSPSFRRPSPRSQRSPSRAVARARRRRARDPGGVRRSRRRPGRRPASGRYRRRPLQRQRHLATSRPRARGAGDGRGPSRCDHGHGRPWRVRASDRATAWRRRADLRASSLSAASSARGYAALRLRGGRSGERAPARGARDGVPVSFGVLTLERVEQAEPRIEKGGEAVRSALEMADVFSHLRAAASHYAAAATLPVACRRSARSVARSPAGNNRSHSMVATRRRFNPNLQRVRVLLEGHPTRALRLRAVSRPARSGSLALPPARARPVTGAEGGRV